MTETRKKELIVYSHLILGVALTLFGALLVTLLPNIGRGGGANWALWGVLVLSVFGIRRSRFSANTHSTLFGIVCFLCGMLMVVQGGSHVDPSSKTWVVALAIGLGVLMTMVARMLARSMTFKINSQDMSQDAMTRSLIRIFSKTNALLLGVLAVSDLYLMLFWSGIGPLGDGLMLLYMMVVFSASITDYKRLYLLPDEQTPAQHALSLYVNVYSALLALLNQLLVLRQEEKRRKSHPETVPGFMVVSTDEYIL